MIKILKPEEAKRRILFCNNLRDMIRHGSINAIEAAKRIGVSPSVIYEYARGTTYPNEERIQEIADALECTVDDLYDDTFPPINFD